MDICPKDQTLDQLFQSFLQRANDFASRTKKIMNNFPQKKTRSNKNNLHFSILQNLEELKESFESMIIKKTVQAQSFFQETIVPHSVPMRPRRNLFIKGNQAQKEESSSDDESSYEVSPQPKKINKSKVQRSRKVDAHSEKKKKNNSRGDYITVSPELRTKLFQILYEQAQIWFDIMYNPDVRDELKRKRELQLITNEKVPQSHESEKPTSPVLTTQPSGKDSLASLENLVYSPYVGVSNQDYQSPLNFQDPDTFIKSYAKDDSFSWNQNSSQVFKKEEPIFLNAIGNSDTVPGMDLAWNSFLVPQINESSKKSEEEENSEGKLNTGDETPLKKGNKIMDIPLKPLGNQITLTIKEHEITKYLKDNENKVNEENKQTNSESKLSIIKALSKRTEINEKTLRRIADGGPERKKGGGRKRLDSEMEEKLTSYVVELNKRGRPPTRGEVKNLGQLLSTVSDFRGSKGWLDKYLNRVKEDMKHKDARFKELFRLLSYADLRKVEAKKPILSCLAEIGASDEFIQKFQEMSHDKPLINQSHSYFEDTDDANCKEEEENISRKKIFTEKDKALYHFSNRENVYLEDNETKLQAWRNPVSESLK